MVTLRQVETTQQWKIKQGWLQWGKLRQLNSDKESNGQNNDSSNEVSWKYLAMSNKQKRTKAMMAAVRQVETTQQWQGYSLSRLQVAQQWQLKQGW